MQFRTKLQEKLLDLNASLPEGLKWIFSTLIKTCLSFIFLILHHHHFSSFIFSLISQLSLLDYFFIWCPISDPYDPMAHPQHRLLEDISRQSDPSLLAPYFSQNHVGLNEGELVLPFTRLHLYRSSEASNEVGFLIILLYSVNFSIIT